MKFLVIGTGSIGRRHFQNLWTLGFRDISVLRSKRRMDIPQRDFLELYKPKVFYDLKTALMERPSAVLICNPTSLHISIAREAIRAGSHVFLEKPLSDTKTGIKSMIQESLLRSKVVYVGYHFRHHPLTQATKKLLVSNELGDLHSAQFVTGEYLPNWHPWEDYRKGYAARSELGGGVTLTLSHDLDLIYWFFGMPKTVSAVILNTGILGINTDDIASISFTSKQCPIINSRLDFHCSPPQKNFSINGSKGSLNWDFFGNQLQLITNDGKKRIWNSPSGFEKNDMYIAEIKNFLHCIQHNVNPECDGFAGQSVLSMALLAKKAGQTGRTLGF
jgi:predicted dehydrogenase